MLSFETYMRMFRGNFRDKKLEQNLVMEVKEVRSISRTMMVALVYSSNIFCFISSAFLRFLAAITILIPLIASTLAVSAPIPDVAPFNPTKDSRDAVNFLYV